jgi:hypothetical protein
MSELIRFIVATDFTDLMEIILVYVGDAYLVFLLIKILRTMFR